MRQSGMSRATFTVCAAQPRVVADDLAATTGSHVAAIVRAAADLIVFPELSLTGYELGTRLLDPEEAALRPLVEACADTGSTALVGAPVRDVCGTFIGMLRIDGTGVDVAYRKCFLGADETARFDAGPGAASIEVAEMRVGLGICRDTDIDEHLRATAALDIDVYACGVVHHHGERAEQERRARRLAEACDAPVVMASFAGPTGGGYRRTAGHSAIWSAKGERLCAAGTEPDGIAVIGLPQISRR